MERWGTLSVKDHLDARALATEVLLYDSLVFPRPTPDDFQRWVKKKWEPDKLYKRMDQLGTDIAYPEAWSSARRNDWNEKWTRLKQVAVDAKGLVDDVPYIVTRLRLAQNFKPRLPDGKEQPEVFAVSRTRRNTTMPIRPGINPAEAADYVLATRLKIPTAKEPEDALKLTLQIARDGTFKARRRNLQVWQRALIKNWSAPGRVVSERDVKNAMAELDTHIKEFNDFVCGKERKRREEVMITFGLLGLGALGTVADPSIGPAIGLNTAMIGGLFAPTVAKVVGFGGTVALQVRRLLVGASEPDAAAHTPTIGAMFHQVERAVKKDAGWWARLAG